MPIAQAPMLPGFTRVAVWCIAIAALQFVYGSAAEAANCGPLHERWVEQPRRVTTEGYKEATRAWEGVYKRGMSWEQLKVALDHPVRSSPEGLMALADKLVDRAFRFSTLVEAMERDGIVVETRQFRFPTAPGPSEGILSPWGLQPRRLTIKNRVWRFQPKLLFIGRQPRVVISGANKAPKNAEELLAAVSDMAVAMTSMRLRWQSRSSLISTPWEGRYAFNNRFMVQLKAGEATIYAHMDALSRLLGGMQPSGLAGNRLLGDQASFWISAITRIALPFYNPFNKVSPNRTRYEAFKADFQKLQKRAKGPLRARDLKHLEKLMPELSRLQAKEYNKRAKLRWLVDHYRFLMTGALIMSIANLPDTIEKWISGEIIEEVKKDAAVVERLANPALLNKAVEFVDNLPDGNPLIKNYFEPKLNDLIERIEKEGDPQGELEKELEEIKVEYQEWMSY